MLSRRGGGLVPADAAEVTPYVAGTSTPYPAPLYDGPDATTPLTFPVLTGTDGVVALWADTPGRLEVEAVHPVTGRNRVTLDLEPSPSAPPPRSTPTPGPRRTPCSSPTPRRTPSSSPQRRATCATPPSPCPRR